MSKKASDLVYPISAYIKIGKSWILLGKILIFIIKCLLKRFKTEGNPYSLKRFLSDVECKYGTKASGDTKTYLTLLKKQQKCKLAIQFIEYCLKHQVLPTFTQFKIANEKLNKSFFINSLRHL